MRITMSSGAPPSPCGVYARGETEDYTVIISAAITRPAKLLPFEGLTETAIRNNLYPNPVTDRLNIVNNSGGGIVKIEILNAAGNILIVHSANPGQSIITVPVQKLSPGIYFIRITNKDKFVVTKKIIKN
jgi:hypothetical protein